MPDPIPNAASTATPTTAPWLHATRAHISVHTADAHASAQTFTQALAQDIAQRLRDAIAARGHAVLCVSGGKSPIALFEALRVQPLPWSQVRVTLADERCVLPDHPDSNALLVQQHLLQEQAAAAQWVPMVHMSADASSTQEALPAPTELAEQADAALVAAGCTDVLVLGMGADGHTASLFPDASNLGEALDPHNTRACMAMALPHLPANAPYPRLSQTLAHLLRARHIVLPLSGNDKLHTLAQAWREANTRYPISQVLHQTQTPVALWITP